ncbi:MAG TPA: MotA/TolQ/ExbB proton channel family protein [Capsulimonadaceae bacterium]|nr:MotA/TolQ/ExbB proton channel family protein [Capsulimonadaceae bacterium]
MHSLVQGWDFLSKGGPVMWPLLVCAVLSITFMIERFVSLRRASQDNDGLLEEVRSLLNDGRADEALRLCQNTPGTVPQLVASAVRNRHLDAAAIERTMEELAMRETPTLYKHLVYLDTIITLAPLLGLLGTVTGMISAFHVVASQTGLNAPTAITGGVAEALIATATGLAIAIVTLVGYNLLTERVKEIIADMEARATQILNILATMRSVEEKPLEVIAKRA